MFKINEIFVTSDTVSSHPGKTDTLLRIKFKDVQKDTCALRDYKQLMPITHETGSTVVQQWNIVATINEYVTWQDLWTYSCAVLIFYRH
jgi:hypothetical protein